ncbi:hypothetical protein [uncultured Nocardioides sp.]|uniref:hypothetical protein n=1 Tax=uncultured Nocardioides sp. TaxID=198441 RepID=UPI0030FBD0C9
MSPGVKVALVPGVLALLPAYAGRTDPIADLRAACLAAVEWLGEDVTVVADPQGLRVAEALGVSPGLGDARRRGSSLLDQRGGGLDGGFETVASATSSTNVGATSSTDVGASSVLVVANGSARRSEKAPGHLDERAAAYDSGLEKALRAADGEALRALDPGLAEELMVGNVAGFARLGELLTPGLAPEVDYADDPFGAQYWVMRWSLPA